MLANPDEIVSQRQGFFLLINRPPCPQRSPGLPPCQTNPDLCPPSTKYTASKTLPQRIKDPVLETLYWNTNQITCLQRAGSETSEIKP